MNESSITITLENLYLYNYLSYANFASYALLLTLGIKDPFLGKPVDPSQVKAGINDINNEIMRIIKNKEEETEEKRRKKKRGGKTKNVRIGSNKLNDCFSRRKEKIITTTQDYFLKEEDFDKTCTINTYCFMDFEVRELIRVFGGGGDELKKSAKSSLAVAKLALLGSELTWVGKVFGGNEDYLLFLDIDPSIKADVYPKVRDFFRRISRELADEVSQVAKVVAPAAIVLTSLYNSGQNVKSVIRNGVIIHLVSDNSDTMFDLTRIMDFIWRLGLASHISTLAGNVSTSDIIIDLLNRVSQAVYETANTGRLLPIYEYARYAFNKLEDENVVKSLDEGLVDILYKTLYNLEHIRVRV